MLNHGSFIISLDFEMMWGVKDICTPQGYGQTNVKNVREVISRMLDLFERYGAHATFATVGLAMFNNKEQALQNLPQRLPQYNNRNLSPYVDNYIEHIEEAYSELYFTPDIINRLKQASSYIEIATHTFCHYNCWAEGQSLEEFESDIAAAAAVAKLQGVEPPKSIVFPRNNVDADYVSVCGKYGITSYRGNAKRFYSKAQSRIGRLWQRVARLVDSYVRLTTTSIKYSSLAECGTVLNIPASRFLRPYSKRLSMFEWLKIRRIQRELQYAAKHNELYHLWWHPHNFGDNIEENLKNLEQILKQYSDCNKKYGMQSYTMAEFCDIIDENR